MGKCIVGGLIGGVIGAAVWGAIAYFTGYEIGWIAWGVGVVVGMGVRIAADGETGFGLGATASAVALASILAGKFMASYLIVDSIATTMSKVEVTDEQAQSYIADKVVEEYQAAGKTMKWPEGMDVESAEEEKDYPPEVWKDMKERWTAMSPAEQKDFREQMRASFVSQMRGASAGIAGSGVVEGLSWMDGLFAVLALASAFRIGSGAVSTSGH